MSGYLRKSVLAVVVASVLGGGVSAPVIIDALTPAKQVTVKSFKIKKTKTDLGDIKAGSKYCSVTVEHNHTKLAAPIPAPAETCGVLTKGQEITVKANEIIFNL